MTNEERWDIFSAKSEYDLIEFDAWGRFTFKNANTEVVSRPLVSESMFQQGFRPRYPDGKLFAVNISHDIDYLFLPNFTLGKRCRASLKELSQFNWRHALRYWHLDDPINPYYNIDKILKTEGEYGVKSSFYFLSLQPEDEDYNFETQNVKELFRMIVKSGGEVGLHGGHKAFLDLNRMQLEKSSLERSTNFAVNGYRNHYLKFSVPTTWVILEEANFSYDSTFGFPDHPGFRNGMCYPFFPYDRDRNKFLQVLEIPLLIMDATFIFYLKWSPDQAIEYCKKIIDQVQSIQGIVTILWHNNYYTKPWDKVIKALLSHCAKKNAWFCTGQELNDWWRHNKFCDQYASFGLEVPQHG